MTSPPALAVIDGTLCQLARDGARTADYSPLATAVIEFRVGPMRVIVREHPHGFLPGFPNLYCLDGDLRLQWVADWPESAGACLQIIEETADYLRVQTASGMTLSLDAHTGRLQAVEHPVEATG